MATLDDKIFPDILVPGWFLSDDTLEKMLVSVLDMIAADEAEGEAHTETLAFAEALRAALSLRHKLNFEADAIGAISAKTETTH